MSVIPDATDLSLERIAAAPERIDAAFLGTPQFVDVNLSARFDREIVVKNEAVTPIGSFKGRGAWLLADELDPARTWVCATHGNFGQGLTYAARARGASVEAFVAPDAPAAKVLAMQALGARVHASDQPGRAAREHAAADDKRLLVADGLGPAMAEGAATIAIELEATGPIDLAIVQVGDGALAAGIARRLKATRHETTVIGVCARGAPAMAESYAARRVVTGAARTIAGAIAITHPISESVARLLALVDDIVLIDDDDLRQAQQLVEQTLGVQVEPAGAAGIAALTRHPDRFPAGRTAVILTGAAISQPMHSDRWDGTRRA